MLKIKLIAAAMVLAVSGTAVAQESGCTSCQSGGTVIADAGVTYAADGSAMDVPCFGPKGKPYPARRYSFYNAAHDAYHPHPHYAYGHRGIDATREHAWNTAQMQAYPWHGNYSYWKYNTPTAVVVPPTAAFQTTYQWGVGQTQSTPIHHQFQHQSFGGGIEGGAGGAWTPYWPHSTQQFGLYPVRAPWH